MISESDSEPEIYIIVLLNIVKSQKYQSNNSRYWWKQKIRGQQKGQKNNYEVKNISDLNLLNNILKHNTLSKKNLVITLQPFVYVWIMVAVDQILRNSKSYWKVDTVPLLSWLKLIQNPSVKQMLLHNGKNNPGYLQQIKRWRSISTYQNSLQKNIDVVISCVWIHRKYVQYDIL